MTEAAGEPPTSKSNAVAVARYLLPFVPLLLSRAKDRIWGNITIG